MGNQHHVKTKNRFDFDDQSGSLINCLILFILGESC